MANLGDFNPDTDLLPVNELYDIDRWALSRLGALIKTSREAYDSYQFHIVYHAVNNFCTIDMSKLYIDITKDRVYVERSDSRARRSAQSAMYRIINALDRLIAPLLAFTAEEIWQAMPHASTDDRRSVYLNPLPTANAEYEFDGAEKYEALFELRDDIMKGLELARAEKRIGKSLDAKVTVFTTDEKLLSVLKAFGEDELASVFITSGAHIENAPAPENAYRPEDGRPIGVLVEAADGEKCDRCWCYSTHGEKTEDGFLCDRCRSIIG
ncbi:MAG: class I tRNA ligase family protein [Eubacteriales bacterium]|nr:class I tRNA ligase family protein [Eubacteriales bacterium]